MAGDKVQLELSKDEVLVFFEWLARFNDTDSAKFEDPAEQAVLLHIEAWLEKTLLEPLQADYAEQLAKARARLRHPE